MYASIKYWVWLADLLPTAVGHRVYQFFNSPIEAFLAEPERYDLIPGLTRQQKELLCHASLDRADSILEECARKEIRRGHLAGRRLSGTAAQYARSAPGGVRPGKTLPL